MTVPRHVAGVEEAVMAWVEQTGKRSWRVRYPRSAGGNGSVSGSTSRTAAQDYAADVESDRRLGRWLDPDGAKTTVGSWAVRWVPPWMWRPAPRRTTGPTSATTSC